MVEAVVDRHLERRVLEQVLQPRAGTGQLGRVDGAGFGGEHQLQGSGQVAARVTGAAKRPADRGSGCPSRVTMPGQPIGSTVDSVTCSSDPLSRSGAVADGTTSRRATHSVSSARPAKGRATNGVRAGFVGLSCLRRLLMRLFCSGVEVRAQRSGREDVPMRIAVVGAGIAGIACARGLVAAGHEVVVLDRGKVPGGRMASRRFDGRYVDLGPPTSPSATRPSTRSWPTGRPVASRVRGPPPSRCTTGPGAAKAGPVRWAAPGGLRSLVVDLARG